MKRTLYILFLAIITTSCKWEGVYELPFDKPQIVLNSILSADKSPEIFVGYTWKASGKIPDNPYYDNATVLLYENDKLATTLKYKGNGIYYAPDFLIKSLGVYYFKVTVPNVGQVQNSPVAIPDFPQIKSMSAKALPRNEGDIILSFLDNPSTINYYAIGLVPVYKGNLLQQSNILRPIELGDIPVYKYNSDCIKEAGIFDNFEFKTKSYEYALVYSNACFTKPERNIEITMSIYSGYQDDYADSFFVNVGFISKEYFEYAKNIKVAEGIDYAFTEPNPTYTNVTGGVGVVLAKNMRNFTVKIQ